jgi:Animal haem peroxidase
MMSDSWNLATVNSSTKWRMSMATKKATSKLGKDQAVTKPTVPSKGVPLKAAVTKVRRATQASAERLALIGLPKLRGLMDDLNIKTRLPLAVLLKAVNRINPAALLPLKKLPEEVRASMTALAPANKRFHGVKASLDWFPGTTLVSPCANKFGYLSTAATRSATALPFTVQNLALLDQLGDLMGDTGREAAIGSDSIIPAGFTYVGQFIDHDITMDVSSSLVTSTDATTIHNMRSPALDLDSLYGRGPALDPFLYDFPSSGNASAIKMALGSNLPSGAGGPGGAAGIAGMQIQTGFDVPRMHSPGGATVPSLTAVIGDPRNDENLIVSQFHHAMLRFHNQVVDTLLLAGFTGDVFVETKRLVTHHYQWAVVNDYLKRICGQAAVTAASTSVVAPVASTFAMPVEFAVAAYRFGHSQVRENYWLNFNFPNQPMGDVFNFIRKPHLPVRSNWVIDFNAFFDTGVVVPINNKARKIDTVLAPALESLPGFAGLLAILAKRNLRRGAALGLPSGQGMATQFGVPALTAAQLTQGLPPNEVAVLTAAGSQLLNRTPLWYYVLREAAVLHAGNQLGPVGGRIVAETIVRMLKRDGGSFLNAAGFVPSLPSAVAGDFGFADLVNFAGVTQP